MMVEALPTVEVHVGDWAAREKSELEGNDLQKENLQLAMDAAFRPNLDTFFLLTTFDDLQKGSAENPKILDVLLTWRINHQQTFCLVNVHTFSRCWEVQQKKKR